MMHQTQEAWVVYNKTVQGKSGEAKAVCEQSEWDAMERARPGFHMLIQAGITSEGAAEKVARGMAVDPRPRGLQR